MTTKTWLVTGCSTGFGRALATILLERGEQVVTTARNPATVQDLVADHRERALGLALDITDAAAVARAVEAAHERFGRIDVLVNNAGYGAMGAVEDTPADIARAMMETNFFGTLAMIQAVLPQMRARGAGQIVNIGSVAGQIGFPTLSYYCASKFALAGLSESLAAELRPFGIFVTLAELGPFATEFTRTMTFHPVPADYDLATLAQTAGNAAWGAGDDPAAGAAALLAALDAPEPPARLILGEPGLEVVALHDARRAAARQCWLPVSRLEGLAE
jgi:NAD(P)-dependent dehydrogenase (short-subunit alcohol dehydrogenase family)